MIPNRRLYKELLRHGSNRTTVRVTFTPRGGTPLSQSAKVTLRAA